MVRAGRGGGEAGTPDVKAAPPSDEQPNVVIDQKPLDKQAALEKEIREKDAAFEKKLATYAPDPNAKQPHRRTVSRWQALAIS